MTLDITEESQVRRSGSHLDARVQGQTVILHGATGIYFGLNESGTELWQLLGEVRTIRELVDELATRFDTSREEILRDVLSVIRELVDAGLVEAASARSE